MPNGIEVRHLPLVREAERVAHGDARLLHRRRRERREADDVAGGVDVRHGRAVVAVDVDVAALVDLDADRLEPEPLGPSGAPARREDLLGVDLEAVVERRHDAPALDAADARGRPAEVERDAERLHRAAQALGDLVVEERQEPRPPLDERDRDAHRREHRARTRTR